MPGIKAVILLAVAVPVLALAACTGEAPRDGAGELAREDVLARGAELYVANCQVCHGDRQGQGGRPGVSPHTRDGHTWHHPDAQLKQWVLDGREFLGMPAFRDRLSEEEVEAILAFIKTWWDEDQREFQADVSKRYQEALEQQQQGRQ